MLPDQLLELFSTPRSLTAPMVMPTTRLRVACTSRSLWCAHGIDASKRVAVSRSGRSRRNAVYNFLVLLEIEPTITAEA